MKTIFCVLLAVTSLGGVGTLRADEALRRVQQSLREQGFYYGPADGSPGDETTQAVRRYQIRNGLPVTGQLDDATKRSIQQTGTAGGEAASGGNEGQSYGSSMVNSGGSGRRGASRQLPAPGIPAPTRREAPVSGGDDGTADPAYQRPTVRPVPDTTTRSQGHDVEDEDTTQTARIAPARPDLRVEPPEAPEPRALPRNAVLPSAQLSDLFASTPYEFAPPPVQADVLRRAQRYLTREGFYDGAVNGVPSEATGEALANFQGVTDCGRLEDWM